MAQITVTFTDMPDGTCKCESSPTFSDMMNKVANHGKDSTTFAEAYALRALREVHLASKEMEKNSGRLVIPVPRLT